MRVNARLVPRVVTAPLAGCVVAAGCNAHAARTHRDVGDDKAPPPVT
jgi:hypothetical protein